MRISDWSSDVCSSDLKRIALLAGALIIAIATAFMARSMFASSGAPQATAANMQPQLDGPQVLVATRALPVGTIIGPDSFRFQPWPKELVEQAYFLKGETDPASLADRKSTRLHSSH